MNRRIRKRQKCEFCVRTFLFKKQLLIHQELAHDKELPYACAKCQRTFYSAWDLNDHIANHFAPKFAPSRSTHRVIERPQIREKNITEHSTVTRILKIILTRWPGKTVHRGTKSGLKVGYRSGPKNYFSSPPPLKTIERKVKRRTVNPEMCAFPCMHGEKKFLRPRQLARHVLITHVKKKVYACTKCDKVFNKRADEVFHLMTHFSQTNHFVEMYANKDLSLADHVVLDFQKHDLNNDSNAVTEPVLIASSDSVLTTSALEQHDSYEINNGVKRVRATSEVSCNTTMSYSPSVDNDASESEMMCTSPLNNAQHDINTEFVKIKESKKRGRKPGSCGPYKKALKYVESVSNQSPAKAEPKRRGRRPGAREIPYKSSLNKFYKSVSTKLASASKKSYYKRVKREVEQSKLMFGCTQCEKKFINLRQLKRHVFINHTQKRVYNCSQCDQVFNRSAVYSAHLAKVHCGGGVVSDDGSIVFACPVCRKTFKKMYYLITHMRRSHTDATACLCTVCGRSFASSYNLQVHESVHNGVLPECDQCGNRCLPATTINRYVRQARTVEQSYTCQQCDKTFVLAFHRKFPTGKNAQTHICAQCGMKFTQRFLLKRHEITHSSEKPFPCKICGKGFGSAWFLNTHMKTRHSNNLIQVADSKITYKCKQCEKTFMRIWDLNQHLKDLHRDSLPHVCARCGEGFVSEGRLKIHESEHNGKLKSTCSACGKSYSQPSALKMHVMRSHSSERPFRCEECGTSFTTVVDLRQHIKKVVHDRTYDCTQCEEKFDKYWNLNRHMKLMHKDGLPPHICSHTNCGERFSSKSSLKLHEAGHTGKLKCMCTTCGQSHLNASALKMHMIRVHNGERPHVCVTCGMSFITSGNLKQHAVVHTGVKPYACVNCDRRFTQISTMNAHIQRVHAAVKEHSFVNSVVNSLNEN